MEYIHGTSPQEQTRLDGLNRITNKSFIDYLGDGRDLRICDFGCGLGILVNDMATKYPSAEIVGLEISADQYQEAARIHQDRANVTLIQTDVLKSDLPENYFDITYCRYLLEHVPDPVAVVREMARVTKPDGKVVSQENDLYNVIYHPPIDGHDQVMDQFCGLQIEMGGAPFIGRELFDIYKSAGVKQIELSYAPEIYTEDEPENYRAWLANALSIFGGVRDELLGRGMIDEMTFDGVCNAFRDRIAKPRGVALFHWNRITGRKG
jgi:SAM-dependent methyltransferase